MGQSKRPRDEPITPEQSKRQRSRETDGEENANNEDPPTQTQNCDPVLDFHSVKICLQTALEQIENLKNRFHSLSKEEAERQNNNSVASEEQTVSEPLVVPNDNDSVCSKSADAGNNDKEESSVEENKSSNDSGNKMVTNDSEPITAHNDNGSLCSENVDAQTDFKEQISISTTEENNSVNASNTDSKNCCYFKIYPKNFNKMADSNAKNQSCVDNQNSSSSHSNQAVNFFREDLLLKAHLVLSPSADMVNVIDCLTNAGIKGVYDIVITSLSCFNTAIVTLEDEKNLNKLLALDNKLLFKDIPVQIKRYRMLPSVNDTNQSPQKNNKKNKKNKAVTDKVKRPKNKHQNKVSNKIDKKKMKNEKKNKLNSNYIPVWDGVYNG